MTVLASREAQRGRSAGVLAWSEPAGPEVAAPVAPEPEPAVMPLRRPKPVPGPVSRPRRRLAGHQVRPGRLVAARKPAPPVVACRPVRTERRVLAVLVGALLVAGVVVGLVQLSGLAGGGPDVPARTTVVQVVPGETLWDLAERVAPGSPTGDVVARIRQLNGLRGTAIHPGEPLVVPDGGGR